ncbi:MAG: FAD-dependent oxidoreductase [Arenicellales bacterium]|nr:FAD-dependent oxidoreductase [Arenicellales bacterium]|tara:strand:- start:6296 stop:7966 length:1671 start_codon:yes stop_codon:yes gene_type:complete
MDSLYTDPGDGESHSDAPVLCRPDHIEALTAGVYDTLVIGAGINGAASAAALSHAGARTALVDSGDFGGFTSQNSSNLIWGGIKYLENLEFGLVRRLNLQRNELMRTYPSAVQEIRFFVAVQKASRIPLAAMWAGSWLYWFIGNCHTDRPRLLSRKQVNQKMPLLRSDQVCGGLCYSDARLVDGDARFVFNLLKKAVAAGAVATNYVKVVDLHFGSDRVWDVTLEDGIGARRFHARTRTLVNAGGPCADQLNKLAGFDSRTRHAYSKGVHLIVDKILPADRVLTILAEDGRMFFAIPFGGKTCIGTTDTRTTNPTEEVTDSDRLFILENINRHLDLDAPLTKADILAERCGVRPLVVSEGDSSDETDWLKLSRKHKVELDHSQNLVCVFGGKFTDCLEVGREVREKIRTCGLPLAQTRWYGEPDTPARSATDARVKQAKAASTEASKLPWDRLWRVYGELTGWIADRISADPTAAEIVIPAEKISRAELECIRNTESVVKFEDFVRRRTSLAQTHDSRQLAKLAGIKEAGQILFGDQAENRYSEYFSQRVAADSRD